MSCFSNYKPNYTVLAVIAGFLTILAFGISVCVIYSTGTKFESSLYPYPDFASIQTYTADIDVINTRWTYDLNVPGYSGKIQQKCPTLNHDADLYINGHLIARTDRKTLSLNQMNYILDGMGSKLFQIKTGDFAETLLNGNKIVISLGIYDIAGKFIGYYSGQNFIIQNNVFIQDIYGNNVIKMTRELDPLWKWTITLLNNTAPFNDFRLGALLAGYVSFSEDSKKTDLCNNYFWATSWTLVAIVSICVIGILYFVYNYIKSNGCDCFDSNKFKFGYYKQNPNVNVKEIEVNSVV